MSRGLGKVDLFWIHQFYSNSYMYMCGDCQWIAWLDHIYVRGDALLRPSTQSKSINASTFLSLNLYLTLSILFVDRQLGQRWAKRSSLAHSCYDLSDMVPLRLMEFFFLKVSTNLASRVSVLPPTMHIMIHHPMLSPWVYTWMCSCANTVQPTSQICLKIG
jgi:hypothetical protein